MLSRDFPIHHPLPLYSYNVRITEYVMMMLQYQPIGLVFRIINRTKEGGESHDSPPSPSVLCRYEVLPT